MIPELISQICLHLRTLDDNRGTEAFRECMKVITRLRDLTAQDPDKVVVRRGKSKPDRLTPITFNVHDMIETPGFTRPRLYSVLGIHLGALHQESVIEMESLDETDPSAHGKKQSMFVPQEMLVAGINSGVFQRTPSTDLG